MSVGSTLQAATRGVFPAADGCVEFEPAPRNAEAAVLSFTDHVVIAADIDRQLLESHLLPHAVEAAMQPGFILALEEQTGVRSDGTDLVLAALGSAEPSDLELFPTSTSHPRLERARCVRADVKAFATSDQSGRVILGRGLEDRWELSIEIDRNTRSRGLGTRLAVAARSLVPTDEALFAQVAPGGMQSLRMLLAAGFVPVCSEVLFLRGIG